MEMEHAVRRLEWVEAEALTEFHRAATPELRTSAGLELHQVDGARASLMRGGGNIVINRCIGFGLAQPGTVETVKKIRQIYADAGIERYFLHLSSEATPQPLTELAEQAGLVRDRAWMKFVREDLPVARRITALEVREIDREHAGDFGRIASAAFGLGAPAAEILAGLVGRSGWHVFMSFDGTTPVGTGALFVKDGAAWTDWAATRPEYRRRGSQSALLARRVAVAVDLGCDLIGTCTGEAVPGDEQASYQNLLRCGFEEAGLRENYSPTGRPAGP